MDNMAAYKHALLSQMRDVFFVSFIIYFVNIICYIIIISDFHFRVRGSDSIQFLFGSTNPATDLFVPTV